MEYSNEDNNTDRYEDLDDCMAKSSDIIEEMDNWLAKVDKTNSNKENINLSLYKRWPRCTVHLHRTAICMQLQRTPTILKNSPSDSTCAHVVPIRENYKETLTVERKPMILTKDFSAHS